MDEDFLFDALENLPVTSNAFGRIGKNYVSVVNADPTAEPPKKSPRLPGQNSASARSVLAKGKQRAGSRGTFEDTNNASQPRFYRVQGYHALPSLPKSYTNELMPLLRRTINNILDPSSTELAPGLAYEQAYQACHVLITHQNEGAAIYDNLKMSLERCVSSTLKGLVREAGLTPMGSLQVLVKQWRWFEAKLGILHSMLVYLDRLFVDVAPGDHLHVRNLGRHIWRRTLNEGEDAEKFLSIAKNAIIEWSTAERDAIAHDAKPTIKPEFMDIDRSPASLARSTMISFINLTSLTDLYYPFFLEPYALSTKSYYAAECLSATASLTPAEYILNAARRTDQEIQRLKECTSDLPPGAWWGNLLEIVDDELLRSKIADEKFCSEALASLTKAEDYLGLKQFYICYNRIGAVKMLQIALKENVKNSVISIIKNPEEDSTMIARLIALKAVVEKVVSSSFVTSSLPTDEGVAGVEHGDQAFINAVKDAFTLALTTRKKKPAELLAKYLDAELKKGQQGTSDAEFEQRLNPALALHSFVPDKDVFLHFFERALAKRLLLQKSASDDFEKQLLKRMGEELDSELEKGTKMFDDLDRSRQLISAYRALHPSPASARFNPIVGTASSWPTYETPKTAPLLPPEFATEIARFEAFHVKEKANSKLTWVYGLWTMSLAARFPKAGEKVLEVSFYQGLVLLLFNEREKMTFKEIRDAVNIDADELTRAVQSLALGRKKVLVKRPATKEVADTDEIMFNALFEDSARNIRINTIQGLQTVKEDQKTDKDIEEQRNIIVDAAVVRILKANKKVQHEDLLIQTIEAAKKSFPLQPKLFKQRIERLIDQEYMRRDDDDATLYHYIA